MTHIFILTGILAKNEGPGEIVCMYKLNPSLIHVALIYPKGRSLTLWLTDEWFKNISK